MRTIELKNDKLSKILTDKGEVHKEIGEINEKIYKLDKDRTKLGYKNDSLKEKTAKIIEKETPSFNLGEFEVISRVYLNKYQRPEVEIVDRIEEFKKMLKEENKSK